MIIVVSNVITGYLIVITSLWLIVITYLFSQSIIVLTNLFYWSSYHNWLVFVDIVLYNYRTISSVVYICY